MDLTDDETLTIDRVRSFLEEGDHARLLRDDAVAQATGLPVEKVAWACDTLAGRRLVVRAPWDGNDAFPDKSNHRLKVEGAVYGVPSWMVRDAARRAPLLTGFPRCLWSPVAGLVSLNAAWGAIVVLSIVWSAFFVVAATAVELDLAVTVAHHAGLIVALVVSVTEVAAACREGFRLWRFARRVRQAARDAGMAPDRMANKWVGLPPVPSWIPEWKGE